MRRQTATSGSQSRRVEPRSAARPPLSAAPLRCARYPRRRRRPANRTASRTRRPAPCRRRHADGDQRPRQRLSRRRLRGLDDAQMLVLVHRDPVAVDPVVRQLRQRGDRTRLARCGARSSRCRNCRTTAPRTGATPPPPQRDQPPPPEIPGAPPRRRPAQRAAQLRRRARDHRAELINDISASRESGSPPAFRWPRSAPLRVCTSANLGTSSALEPLSATQVMACRTSDRLVSNVCPRASICVPRRVADGPQCGLPAGAFLM